MTLRLPPLGFWLALWALPAASVGQQAQIEHARQFQSGNTAPAVPIAAQGGAATTALSDFGDDSESFGIQQLLREQERLRHFRISGELSVLATNNVAFSRVDPRADTFCVAILPLEFRRRLGQGFRLEADLRLAGFRYNRFKELDFNSTDAGLGLSYHAASLGGIDLFARYNYNQLNRARQGDAFFRNHTILVGVQKAIVFSQAHYAFFGLVAQIGFAEPKESERSEASAFAGYHLQATRKLQADLLYRYARYDYTEASRTDQNQTLSLALRYQFAEWASAYVSSFITWNASDVTAFEYDAGNAGGGLTLSLEF
jgi:hypothetical protein